MKVFRKLCKVPYSSTNLLGLNYTFSGPTLSSAWSILTILCSGKSAGEYECTLPPARKRRLTENMLYMLLHRRCLSNYKNGQCWEGWVLTCFKYLSHAYIYISILLSKKNYMWSSCINYFWCGVHVSDEN